VQIFECPFNISSKFTIGLFPNSTALEIVFNICDNNTMGKKLNFRIYSTWFHGQLKRGRFPTVKQIETKYELSHRTAQRVIEYMRDDLEAPIEYSRKEKGYFYSDLSFDLHWPIFTEKEIMRLIILEPLTQTIPDSRLKKEIKSFMEKLTISNGIDLTELKKRISIKNVRYDKVDPKAFEMIINALNQNHKLNILYEAKYKKEITTRVVNPLHLLLYNGNWHLFAYCENKHQIRNFALSGIKQIELLEDTIPQNLQELEIGKLIEDNYGIFIHENEADRVNVILKFSKEVTDIVKNQHWFPSQILKENKDGTIILTFPVTDFREIEGDILKFGYHVEVLNPEKLRGRIKETLERMSRLY